MIIYNANDMPLHEISDAIKKGKTIIYPTDTVYGLGATMDSVDAIAKIYKVKSRSTDMPLIALADSIDSISKIAYIDNVKDKLSKLAARFWPGGLTVILKKKDRVPGIMVSNGLTVGVRIPDHPVALSIIKSVGGILPTTSANISGEVTPRSFYELSEEIKKRVDIIIDGGKSQIGTASTIVDLSSGDIKVLRKGSIDLKDIMDTLL